AWAAAVLGTGITVSLCAALTTMSRDEAVRCAGLLRDARILVPPGPGDEALEFRHPMIAATVYASIPDGLRRAMHGIAA
ncbi:hypothetical protein NGM37_49340, partial [Streptomyces sp. TRM76130]|nr:hypothetical protein [Streptomyces sp. TRM76130]